MKYFLKKLMGHEIFRPMVSWATKLFLKNLYNPPDPPPTYLIYAPLWSYFFKAFILSFQIKDSHKNPLFDVTYFVLNKMLLKA